MRLYKWASLVLLAIIVSLLGVTIIDSKPQYIEVPVAIPYPYIIEKTEVKYVEIPVLHTETEIRTIEIPIVYEKVIEKEIPYQLPEGYQAISIERALEIIQKGRAAHEFYIQHPELQTTGTGDTEFNRKWIMYYTELWELILYLANRAEGGK